MTGLGNRIGLRIRLDRAFAELGIGNQAFFIFDVDHFKSINDSIGHSAGDTVLKHIADNLIIESVLSGSLFRIGGDEFAGVIHAMSKHEIYEKLESIIQKIAGLNIHVADQAIRVTVSLGFTFITDDMDREDAYRKADMALYSAKAGGRNQVFGHEIGIVAVDQDPAQTAVEHFENVTRVWTERMSELIRSVGRKAMEEARKGADTDGLTGLYNRAYYDRRILREIETALKSEISLSIILFDVDDFHNVNMDFGYPSGDRALVAVANLVRDHARITDWIARYGGEEFIVILPGADASAATQVAERVRQGIEIMDVRALDEKKIFLTVTVGVASLSELHHKSDTHSPLSVAPEQLVQLASNRVIAGKNSGKNRVISM